MKTTDSNSLTAESINYDDTPIVELDLDGIEYRLDTDHSSAVAVSCRETGTWTWRPMTRSQWDGKRLRAKGLDERVLSALAQMLSAAMREADGG